MGRKLFGLLGALWISAIALAANAQNLPTPTQPLSGSEQIQCLQSGAYKACTPAILTTYTNKITTIKPLSSFGPLGTSDDAATITAANNAIIAAASTGGLIVQMPAWQVVKSSVGLKAANNGGWDCPVLLSCTWQAVRANGDTSVTWAFSLNTPYDTNVLLRGIKFNGTWNNDWLGTGPKAAWIGVQNGVEINNAFNNAANDAMYLANSTLGLQGPNSTVTDIVIAGFGGECWENDGAGGGTFHNIRGQNCGTYGAVINGYDSMFSLFIFGSTGLSSLVCTGAGCANDKFEGIEGWYAGQSQNPAHDHGLEVYGNTNKFDGLDIQDSSGDGLWEDSDFNNNFIGDVQWQGCIPWMDANVAGIRTGGGYNNHHLMQVAVQVGGYACQAAYPNVTAVVNDTLSTSNVFSSSYSHLNTYNLLVFGFPGGGTDFNNYVFVPSWIIGPFDTTNSFNVNGVQRQPRNYLADPSTGNFNSGVPMQGSLVGLVADGPTGFNPGQVGLVAQTGGGSLGGYNSTATPSTGTLTSTGNFSDGDVVLVGATAWTMKSSLTTPPISFKGSVSGSTLTVTETTRHLAVGDLVTAYVAPPGTQVGRNVYISALGSCGGTTCTYTLANYSGTFPSQTMVGKFSQVQIGASAVASLQSLAYAVNALRPTVFRKASQSGNTLTITGGATNGKVHIGDYVTAIDQTTYPYATLTPEHVVSGTYFPFGTSTLTMDASQAFAPAGSGSWTAQSGVVGTDYSYSVIPSMDVTATSDATHLFVTAIVAGSGANTDPTTTTSGSASWGGSTLSGGTDGTAGYTTALSWDRFGGSVLAPTIGTNVVFGNGAQATPTSSSATCVKGTFEWDISFLYMCVATNTWKRIAIATW